MRILQKMDFRKEIEEKGYTVLSNLITEKECNQYKALLDENYESMHQSMLEIQELLDMD